MFGNLEWHRNRSPEPKPHRRYSLYYIHWQFPDLGFEIVLNLVSLFYLTDISMQDQMIIYDNEKQSIGWMPADCDELASLKASQVYEY